MSPGLTAEGLIGLWQRGEVVQYSLTLVEAGISVRCAPPGQA